MKNKKTVLALLCCAAIACTQASCLLAQESVTENSTDRLAGLLVTTRPLDSFDPETLPGGVKDGRLYATIEEDLSGGYVFRRYEFEGLPEIHFFASRNPGDDVMETYYCIFSKGSPGTGGADDRELAIGATISLPSTWEGTFYLNEIYQTEAGSIYAVKGEAVTPALDYVEGRPMRHSFEGTNIFTADGQTMHQRYAIAISFEILVAPERITVLSLDSDGRLLATDEYTAFDRPKNFTPVAGSAFLIVESIEMDPSGTQSVSREIYDRKSYAINAFYVWDDEILCPSGIPLFWTGE